MFVVGMTDATLVLSDNLVHDDLHVRGLGHPLHKQQTGDEQAHLDGDGEVEQDGKEEGDEQHRHVALGVLHQSQKRPPSRHAVAHHHQHACQASHGNVLRQGHEEKEDEQQHHSVHDARYRRASAVVDVGHGAGNGTRGGNAAEERRRDVGNALPYEFGVGVVVVANHTIGHSGREQ